MAWQLQQLPPGLAEAVVACLPSAAKQSLRLTCKAAQALVDASATQLVIKHTKPPNGGLAARFPRLARLKLVGDWMADPEGKEPFARLMDGSIPWTSITSLEFSYTSCSLAAGVVSGCPNVEVCSFSHMRAAAYAQDLVHTTCSVLPSLTSLTTTHKLGDAELRALGGCASLVHLDVQLGQISAGGWQSFLALPLTSLRVELRSSQLPMGALSGWASGMSALTALTLLAGPAAGQQRRRHANCRVPGSATAGALQLDEPQQPAVAARTGHNVLSSPLLAALPFLPVALAVAAVQAYTGVLFADHELMRRLTCGIGLLFSYGISPALDMAIGPRAHHATEHGSNKSLAVLHLLSIVGVISWAWAAVATVPLQPLHFGLMAYTLGLQGTSIIGSAHELIHSKSSLVRGMGELGTAFVNFWGYSRGHMQHHQLLGTPEDHSTARKGETVWRFMARYLTGNYTASWQLEAAECARKGRSNLHNRVLLGVAAQAAFTAAAFAVGGTLGLTLHLVVGSMVLFNMSVFDYVLHYGLKRDRAAGEPVTRALAFNSHYPVEGAVNFNALLHSHHHVAAAKPYGDLETDPDEPTFPAPLNSWALLALMPPLWFRVMDPLVDDANRQHKQLVAAMAGC